MNGNVVIGL